MNDNLEIIIKVRKETAGGKMTVKRIAKSVFTLFISASVSVAVLQVLYVLGVDKYGYYVVGAAYVWIHSILDRATVKWREK
jgi:hypothetical protein